MSNFDDLRTFVEVVEQGSFRGAAKRLGLTPPAVSKRIASLEGRLETQLIHRTTRRLSLTEAGQLYYDQVAAIPARVEEAEERVREHTTRPRGRLRVAMPLFFSGAGMQLDVLPAFMAEHPDVQLEITVASDPSTMLAQSFDVLIAGKLPGRRFEDSSYRSRHLMSLPACAYAAPSYLDARGRPTHPDELAEHDCVSYQHPRQWYFVGPDGAEHIVRPRGPLRTNSNALLWAATMQGRGIAYSFPIFFDDDLVEGNVERVLEEYTADAYVEVHVFHPPARYVPRRTRAFIEALMEQFGRHAR